MNFLSSLVNVRVRCNVCSGERKKKVTKLPNKSQRWEKFVLIKNSQTFDQKNMVHILCLPFECIVVVAAAFTIIVVFVLFVAHSIYLYVSGYGECVEFQREAKNPLIIIAHDTANKELLHFLVVFFCSPFRFSFDLSLSLRSRLLNSCTYSLYNNKHIINLIYYHLPVFFLPAHTHRNTSHLSVCIEF